MQALKLALPLVALAGVTALLSPREAEGFSTLGTKLNLSQADFRVFNNFTDAAANNNTTPHPNFPGYTGAVMALWKGCIEWQSSLHGDGSGDGFGSNPLGSGGANFDPSFQGEADDVGNTNDNIHSELSGNGGSTFAFAEGPADDGWRIRYFQDPWTWRDGPGFEGTDLQGIATHEYGHALGLGHSGVGGATMQPGTGTGIEQRSIHSDDIAGIQSIYGAAGVNKPRITSLSVDPVAGTVTVIGVNFSPTNNTAWFTQKGSGGDGVPIKVSGLVSTDGGTRVTTTIPAAAGPGDLLMKKQGTGTNKISQAFPFDPDSGPPPGQPSVSAVNPSQIAAVTVDGPPTVTLSGSGFSGPNGVSGVEVDGVALDPADFSVTSDSSLEITGWPLVSQVGPVTVTILHGTGTATALIDVLLNDPPVLQLAHSVSEGGLISSAEGLDFTLAGGVGDLHFLNFSGSLVPSVLPGFVDFGIGNNFFSLFALGTFAVPAEGYVHSVLPVAGDLSGLVVHFQAAVLDADSGQVLPLVMTNVQTGQFQP